MDKYASYASKVKKPNKNKGNFFLQKVRLLK